MTPEVVLDFIKQRGDNVTFAELSRMEGAQGEYLLEFAENVVIWTGLSQDMVESLVALRASDRVHYAPTSMLTYVIDGGVMQLPLVKRAQAYKKPHWLPVVVKLGPDPGIAKKKKAARVIDRMQ
jgi:hypothetical protein